MPRFLSIKQIPGGKPGSVYYPLQLLEIPTPTPGPNELLIKMHAAALNHRDLFIRQHLYPAIAFGSPLLADGCGTVQAAGPGAPTTLLGKQVLLMPCRGGDPSDPTTFARFSVIGGTATYPTAGTGQDYCVVPAEDVEVLPAHLTPVEGAALPLVGLTAWRALKTKSQSAEAGHNILVTGIGGGVAQQVLQFGAAMGCNVYVTSSDDVKLSQAKEQLGARGGVNYKTDQTWEKTLATQLPPSRPWLDAVIDGAGGDVVKRTTRLLKPGGVICTYGMTTSPRMDWLMSAVLKNIELRGSTMGSRSEFRDMVEFVRENRLRPVISRAVQGLDNLDAIDDLFDDMRHGRQFGKLVIEISAPGGGNEDSATPKL